MSLGTRLIWWLVGMLALAIALVIILTYREMVMEQGGGHPEEFGEGPEPLWWQAGEIALRAAVPLLVMTLAGWWLIRRALFPLHTLTNAAARINAGNLDENIPLSGRGDELDHLTAVFNDMTARLAASIRQIREFTLHANHELKTPLAVLRAEIGEMLDEPERSQADKERFLSQLDEIERLTRIVNGLTMLTRADANQLSLSLEQVALDELVREAAENTQALAEPGGIKVHLEELPAIRLTADRHRLRQLLLILGDNAVKYNRPGGEVSMKLKADATNATVSVRNTGGCIPAEEQSSIFDRFRRGSNASALDIEGCGLGLSIALWIAHAHGGTLTFRSQPDDTEFSLTLPLSGRQPERAPLAKHLG